MYGFDPRQYQVWSRLSKHKKRLQHTKEVILRAFEITDNWCISCSGGKDSISMAHFINTIKPTPIFSYKDDLVYPGESQYLIDTAKRYGWDIRIHEEMLWSRVEDISRTGGTITDVLGMFSDTFWSAINENNDRYKGSFIGMRAQESFGRRWNYKKRGDIYEMANGFWHAIPIARWEAGDVFAYLVSNDIPIFSLYTKKGIVPPEKRREGWYIPAGDYMRSTGSVVQLKYTYPDLFEKLAELFPELGYET